MKRTIFYSFAFLASATLMLSFSNGPAGGSGNNGPRMQDRTGSPFAIAAGPNCSACHNTGSFNPTLHIELTKDGQTFELYQPGETYTLRYTLSANNGSPSEFGVQSVVLTNDDNNNIGVFGDAPTGTRIADIDDRKYFEHSTASTNPVFEIDWTAPALGTGAVTIYASGITANGNNANSGDNGVANTLVLDELITAVDDIDQPAFRAFVYPNPVASTLNIDIQNERNEVFMIELIDFSGKTLLKDQLDSPMGGNIYARDISDIPSGVYLVKITTGLKQQTIKIVK